MPPTKHEVEELFLAVAVGVLKRELEQLVEKEDDAEKVCEQLLWFSFTNQSSIDFLLPYDLDMELRGKAVLLALLSFYERHDRPVFESLATEVRALQAIHRGNLEEINYAFEQVKDKKVLGFNSKLWAAKEKWDRMQKEPQIKQGEEAFDAS